MDTAEDKRMQEMIAAYALSKAQNGAYMTQIYHRPTSTPVLLVVACGENALALERAVIAAQVPDDKLIQVVNKL